MYDATNPFAMGHLVVSARYDHAMQIMLALDEHFLGRAKMSLPFVRASGFMKEARSDDPLCTLF
jgi:hypothetical protein